MFVEQLVPFGFFAMVFGIAYLYFTSRSKERLALIEKNIDASLFFGDKRNKKDLFTFWTLRIGSLLLGFGIGLLIGNMLQDAYGRYEYIAPPIFIFSGLLWVAEFAIERKIIIKSQSNS